MNRVGYNFIDLFCGCGGLSVGLEMAGHKCLLGVDMDKDAIASFNANHKHAQGILTDIAKLSAAHLKKLLGAQKIDMVVGGPPCQGFSTVGRGDAKDERNHLFKQFVRIVKITEPKVVLFENVTGILAKKNEGTLAQIFRAFERLGYNMDAQVLSADDFGVASSRRRTIIMGVKAGVPSFPTPTSLRKRSVAQVFEELSRQAHLENHQLDKAQLSNKLDRKRLECLPPGAGIRYQKDELAYLPKRLRFGVDWSKISEGRFRQTKLQRLGLDRPAPTILTSRTMYYHPTQARYLTVREAASLQSFPLEFVFQGSVTAQFRQIGNSVPPLLAKALGEEIYTLSFDRPKLKTKKIDPKQLSKKAFRYREPAAQI